MRVEDLDPIDEETVEAQEGHAVDVVLSVRLNPEESKMLAGLAEREGVDEVETMRLALRHYAANRTQRASS